MSKQAVTVAASDLVRVMKIANQVIERRNTIPILSHVLFVAEEGKGRGKGKVTITANDLDCQFVQSIEANVSEPLAIAVPGEKLGQIAGVVAKGAELRFAREDNGARIVISSARSRWTLAALPRDDFPAIPPAEEKGAIAIEASHLARLIGRVLPFASTEQTRYYLNGPLFHPEGGKLALAATDGNCLMRVVDEDTEWPEGAPEVIFAPKACRILQSLGETPGQARLVWSEARLGFEIGDAVLTAKMIDGTFPDYRRVIAAPLDDPATLDVEEVRAAIVRLRIAASKSTNAVLIDPEGGGLTLSMKSDDATAAAREEVPCEPGGLSPCSFNSLYFDQMLAAIGGDTVRFHQADPGAPARFERVVPDGALGTVMPMRR